MAVIQPLSDYSAGIRAFNKARPNMVDIGAYNRDMVGVLDGLYPLKRRRILDLGASPHGYALERALELGVAEYVGVNLNISETVTVQHKNSLGHLVKMNAENLDLEPGGFDAILTISTFEHFLDGAQVLREMHRVLKRGGRALATFEPIWTSAQGHHLHHIPPIGELLPPWLHLLFTEEEMRAWLTKRWRPDLPMTVDETVHWIFQGHDINRVDVVRMEQMFRECPLSIEWMEPLPVPADGDLPAKSGKELR